MTREQFYRELGELDARFNALEPELELRVEDSELGVEGFVVVWSTLAALDGPLGPCGKGGTRITPTVTLDEVKMLARIMTLKNASAGLPLGGAKSGLRADPDAPDFEMRYRRFVSLVRPVLYENGGIFGGFGFDIGARPEQALWACDELGSTRSFTGKPLQLGGTDYDREGIAGLGVATAAAALLTFRGESARGATFAVQGAGAMGGAVVRYFSQLGGKLRAIADRKLGGLFVFDDGPPEGLIDAISSLQQDRAREILTQYEPSKLDLEEILYQDADLLFPCAVQDVLREDNAERVRTRFVVEGANNPCTESARTKLFERGITVIPDFVANPGGIIAAYVEMTSPVSNEENLRTKQKAEEAKFQTRERIHANVLSMLRLAQDLRVEPVHAGRYMALKRIFK